SKSIIRPQSNARGEKTYEFRFQVLVSDVSRDRFAVVTENLEVGRCIGGKCYLSERIHYFIDDKEVTALNLPESTQGKVFTPWITGGAQTKEQATQEMKELQSLMSSGELPVDLKTVRVETVTATHGQEILRSATIAGIGALIAVSVVIFLRYRNRKIILPVILTSFSEVLIILGAASLIGRTIDLPAMAGIIAAIGSSVDDQIVITSETLSDKSRTKYSVKRTVKRAFFIVYMAAATTIVAMMSLASIGVGSMRGFAIMTIIGVLAGVLITRPAYGKILEKIV
ncbi:MAG: MMPL family transporter, partial [Candidatus Aenigmatarchaeota archaeon]